MNRLRVAACVLLVPIWIVAAGCGKPEGPEYAKVTGTVTVDGKPAAGVNVTFHPDATKGTKGPVSAATTDDQGKFVLHGPGGKEGAVVGWYKVTVECPPDPGMFSSPSGPTEEKSGPPKPKDCNVPKKYADITKTDLTFEVKAGQENTINIDLKSE